MSNRTCSVDGCESQFHCKNFCRMHYTRFRIHGDPLVDLHRSKRDSSGLKICKVCDSAKPDSEFHKDSRSPDGLRTQCKTCRNGYMSNYYNENREARVAYEQKRRTERPEHMRALDMARYKRHKAKRIAVASENVKLRRARLAGVETDPKVTVSSLRRIHGDSCCYCGVDMSFERRPRSEGIAPNRATLEHIVPISRGGSHTFDNTALACHRCNVSKNDKTVEEWSGPRVVHGVAS